MSPSASVVRRRVIFTAAGRVVVGLSGADYGQATSGLEAGDEALWADFQGRWVPRAHAGLESRLVASAAGGRIGHRRADPEVLEGFEERNERRASSMAGCSMTKIVWSRVG
jgi:hypothetical protein